VQAKHLFDPSAGIDRLGVALMAGGSTINGGTARSSGVLGHVRCHADPSEIRHHCLGVVVLVACVTRQSTIRAVGTPDLHHTKGRGLEESLALHV
jgi:hypothetical protein